MEVVIFLRLLWRQRIKVAVGAAAAVATAVALGGTPVASSGLAATRVLIDTPRSSLIATYSRGMDTLAWRASLLSILLGTEPARAQLARETGIPVTQIAVIDQELTAPPNPVVLPVAAVDAASATNEPYVLTLNAIDAPIVALTASGPDRAGAARLVDAAVHALKAGASPQTTPRLQGLSITQIDPVTANEIAGGASRRAMALIAFVVFCLWCVGVAVLALRRSNHRPRRLLGRAGGSGLIQRLHTQPQVKGRSCSCDQHATR